MENTQEQKSSLPKNEGPREHTHTHRHTLYLWEEFPFAQLWQPQVGVWEQRGAL